ncbi:hypothetical protein RBSH_00020 [Rhodopirellula baltica SH28]|uniref:Uncharacterized protein n=1 Tax=Rhodopirellula baltica SH28 TaxID=993517 RepID=K5CKR3_RHOBT|nr:hypothetical protein RBSH_00020 [Rhodopirellula baltica SH28]
MDKSTRTTIDGERETAAQTGSIQIQPAEKNRLFVPPLPIGISILAPHLGHPPRYAVRWSLR